MHPTSKLAKLAPKFIPDPTNNLPTDRKLTPSSPDNTSKLAQTPEREILSEDRTKSPPELASDLGSLTKPLDKKVVPNSPPGNDNLTEAPKNNTQIANNNRQGSIGSGSNGNDNGNSGGSNKPGTGTPGNMATGSSNRASIQCLRNCEIRYPHELENSDIGKDKILVKVTIDPNGTIVNAEIDRSSGNQNLDRVTLAGVKQMQLSATGKTKTYRIKVSTLLR